MSIERKSFSMNFRSCGPDRLHREERDGNTNWGLSYTVSFQSLPHKNRRRMQVSRGLFHRHCGSYTFSQRNNGIRRTFYKNNDHLPKPLGPQIGD